MTRGAVRLEERTGTGTRALFGAQDEYYLERGFPLVTTKKIHFKSVVYELLWMLSGESRIDYLQANGVTIWNEWVTPAQVARFGREEGDLGPVYGVQWRHWKTPDGRAIDQIAELMEGLRKNPESRRHIVMTWNPADVDKVALPPCHMFFQCFVADGELSLQMYQRSADMFLGVPFNIASYALLTHMIAHVLGLRPGVFVHSLGDYHLYSNHLEQARTQLLRTPRPLPKLVIKRKVDSIFDFKYEDFLLEGYDPYPKIAADVSV